MEEQDKRGHEQLGKEKEEQKRKERRERREGNFFKRNALPIVILCLVIFITSLMTYAVIGYTQRPENQTHKVDISVEQKQEVEQPRDGPTEVVPEIQRDRGRSTRSFERYEEHQLRAEREYLERIYQIMQERNDHIRAINLEYETSRFKADRIYDDIEGVVVPYGYTNSVLYEATLFYNHVGNRLKEIEPPTMFRQFHRDLIRLMEVEFDMILDLRILVNMDCKVEYLSRELDKNPEDKVVYNEYIRAVRAQADVLHRVLYVNPGRYRHAYRSVEVRTPDMIHIEPMFYNESGRPNLVK